MIKLLDIITEDRGKVGYNVSATKRGAVKSRWAVRKMIVIEDLKDGLTDPKKRKIIMSVIDRYLKKKTRDLDYDFSEIKPDDIIKNLKYYEKTDKIVGIIPQYMFKNKKIDFKNSLFYTELNRFYPNLTIREKKGVKKL